MFGNSRVSHGIAHDWLGTHTNKQNRHRSSYGKPMEHRPKHLSLGLRSSPCSEFCRLDFHMAGEHAERSSCVCKKLRQDHASRGSEGDQKGVVGLPCCLCFTVVGRVRFHCDFLCVRSYQPSIFPSSIINQPNARGGKGIRVSSEI